MTLNVPSFFAGIGTVVVLLTLGFGGGVLMSGVISDKPREPGKVEKWAAEGRRRRRQKTPGTRRSHLRHRAPVITATPVPVAPAAPPPAPQTIVNAEPAPQPAQPWQPPSLRRSHQRIRPSHRRRLRRRRLLPRRCDKHRRRCRKSPSPWWTPLRLSRRPSRRSRSARTERRDERRKQVTERRRQPQIDNAPEAAHGRPAAAAAGDR